MGKFDRRNSQKMKRRKAQAKKKERVARQKGPGKKEVAGAKTAKKAVKRKESAGGGKS